MQLGEHPAPMLTQALLAATSQNVVFALGPGSADAGGTAAHEPHL